MISLRYSHGQPVRGVWHAQIEVISSVRNYYWFGATSAPTPMPIKIERKGPLNDNGCYNLKLSGDQFELGITNYNKNVRVSCSFHVGNCAIQWAFNFPFISLPIDQCHGD